MRMNATSSVLLLITVGGCCSDPWSAYPEKTPPDRSCFTGDGTHGKDIYIWDCLRGEKIVVSQYSAEMTCQSPKREKLACGAKSAVESEPDLKCGVARRDWVAR